MLRTLTYTLLAALAVAGCKPKDDGDANPANFDRGPMLAHLADSLMLPGYATLHTEAEALLAAAIAFEDQPTAPNLTALRGALGRAWFAWQDVSMFEVGPAMQQSLRTNLSTFPPNPGTIEVNISNGTWNLGTAGNTAAKGFPALDYLLFSTDSTSLLTQFAGADSAATRRRRYLRQVAQDVATRSAAVYAAWPAYRATFVAATGTDVGSSAGLFFNDYLFDFEVMRRNKIGDCIGVRFLNTIRPEQVEAYYSRWSRDLAAANARAHLRAFKGQTRAGTDGPGLDDWLNALGAQGSTGPLAQEVAATMQAGIDKLIALPSDLSTACTTHTQDVRNAYNDFQRCVVLFKADVASALGLLITYQDNDGD